MNICSVGRPGSGRRRGREVDAQPCLDAALPGGLALAILTRNMRLARSQAAPAGPTSKHRQMRGVDVRLSVGQMITGGGIPRTVLARLIGLAAARKVPRSEQ